MRGEADAERNRIYADAFGRDPEFFAFTRSLTAYERALQAGNSSIVMQPDSTFFEYLRSDKVPTGDDLSAVAGREPATTPDTAAPATADPASAPAAEPAVDPAPEPAAVTPEPLPAP